MAAVIIQSQEIQNTEFFAIFFIENSNTLSKLSNAWQLTVDSRELQATSEVFVIFSILIRIANENCNHFRNKAPMNTLSLMNLTSWQLTCLWMMLSRKSGLRLRHSRCPKRSDWFRLFSCSWMCGGGLRGGPLSWCTHRNTCIVQSQQYPSQTGLLLELSCKLNYVFLSDQVWTLTLAPGW